MKRSSLVSSGWREFMLPIRSIADLEATARKHGAFRRSRAVKDPETQLRLAVAYGACGMSLRETCTWAEMAGVARLSDPALLKRLKKSANWLAELVGGLIARQLKMKLQRRKRWEEYRLRAFDATTICQPGASGTTWRLHVGYDVARGQVDMLELTDDKGAESLNRFGFKPGDIGMGDRGYGKPRDFRPVLDAGADLIVRIGWNALCLLTPEGAPFDLFATLAKLKRTYAEVPVCVDERAAVPRPPLALRLIIRRKTKEQADAAQKDLIQQARKKSKTPDPRSLEAAKYVLLLTSLPAKRFSPKDILDLYRLRWQIELAFKRLKSLCDLGQLPAKHPDLARTWIYAKLLAALIAEQRAGQVPDSPPSAPGSRKTKPRPTRALAPRQAHLPKHLRRHSRSHGLARPATRAHPGPTPPA